MILLTYWNAVLYLFFWVSERYPLKFTPTSIQWVNSYELKLYRTITVIVVDKDDALPKSMTSKLSLLLWQIINKAASVASMPR